MKFVFGKAGGMVATIGRTQFCIFPANTMFAKSPRVVVLFGIGFSWNRSV